MVKDETNLQGTTIRIENGTATFIPEDNTPSWWRSVLNRKTEGILCPQIIGDMNKIAINLSKLDEQGNRIGKYEVFSINLNPNPKSSQGAQKTKYRKRLVRELERKKKDLEKFRDKKILLYIAIYLREKRFKTWDVDNFVKAIMDALKEYVGDDSKVVTLIAEKKKLGPYPAADMDFLEQIFIVVTDPRAKADIFKN